MRIREGDPLEIYTSKDGEVIFKKYSLMGGLSDFAGQLCETLHKTLGRPALIADRDSIVALSGLSRRELLEKRVSRALENIMEERQIYQYRAGEPRLPLCDGQESPVIFLAAPILTEGDVMGCVVFADEPEKEPLGQTEYKLAQTISGFLGRHMEA